MLLVLVVRPGALFVAPLLIAMASNLLEHLHEIGSPTSKRSRAAVEILSLGESRTEHHPVRGALFQQVARSPNAAHLVHDWVARFVFGTWALPEPTDRVW